MEPPWASQRSGISKMQPHLDFSGLTRERILSMVLAGIIQII